jgi:hypothetical protein
MATGERFDPGDMLTVVQSMGPTTSQESGSVKLCDCSGRFLKPLLDDILETADPALLPVT